MTSNINPNDIDGAYPVAGQDNNSQGFRDNFTNTKTNFQYAADEITDLQNKAVLKAALTGTSLDNNMQGSLLYNVQLQQTTETAVPLGTLSGTVTLNFAAGSYQTLTTSGPITLGFSNLPAAGVEATWIVSVTVANTAHTITFPTAVSVNTVGIQGLNTSTNVLTVAAVGIYSFTFSTNNGGSTVNIAEVNKQIQPFNNSAETITANGNISLATTTTVFSATGNIIGNLTPGATGQIKTFVAANLSAGTTATVYVPSAGWKIGNAGNITFTANGQGATLQCIQTSAGNYDWFVIGNNGTTIS
jgi:hypothetical protein